MKSRFATFVTLLFLIYSFNAFAEHAITADELFEKYNNNSVAADDLYKGKTYVVSGIVTDIGNDILGDPYVVIGSTGTLEGVQCSFPKKRKASVIKLSKGQAVSIKGVVSGQLLYVQLRDSKLIEQ